MEASSSSSNHPVIRKNYPWDLTVEERVDAAELHKSSGNLAFTDERTEEAMDHYSQGLKMLIPVYKPPTELKDKVLSLKQTLYLNMSACQLKLRQFDYVIKNCTKALEIDRNSLKALYRRSVAFTELNNVESAGKDIEMGLKIDSNNMAFKKQQKKLESRRRVLDKKTKAMMKYFLQESSCDKMVHSDELNNKLNK